MQLKDYIQGDRRGKDANRLERKAMSDLFLQDALDGFDAVAGDHVPIIERLEKKFTQPAIAPRRNRNLFLYWSAAASVLLLVGMSVYFFLQRNENTTPSIAMLQPDENEQVIANDSSSQQPVSMEESRQEMPTVARANHKEAPASITPPKTLELDVFADEIFVDEIVAEAMVTEESMNDSFVKSTAKVMVKEKPEGRTIRGKVIDETGEPLPGVTIIENGTTIGTVTDINGLFALQVATDSSKLMASFVGYESQEIIPFGEEQTVILKESHLALSEQVVVGYGTQRKRTVTGAVATTGKSDAAPRVFGEKEFQEYCQQNADKNVCDGKGATVKLSFFIDETGKPTKIEFKNVSCEEAKKEMENLLSSSPTWTKTNRKVTMTIKW